MIDAVKLVNTITNQEVTIDQDESDFVLTEIDLGQVTAQHNMSSYYNQIGATVDSTLLQPRPISITGWVIGDSKPSIQNNKRFLNGFINPLQPIKILVYNKYFLICSPDYSVYYGRTILENNDYMCKFLIQGTCGNPLFTSTTKTVVSLSETQGNPLFPLTIPKPAGIRFGLSRRNQVASLCNTGGLPVGVTISIVALDQVVNPSITIVETQESIKINKVLSAGEEITISTASGDKKLKGTLNGTESNYIQYFAYQSAWIRLPVGCSSIQYSADSGVDNLRVTIAFSPVFLEVEE